jgi:hypothetical protein
VSNSFCFRISVRISLVSVTGMFQCMIVMSGDARVKWGRIGMSFSLCIRSLKFSMLNAYGKGASWLIFCVNSSASLQSGALRQFATGRMGWSGLCIFIRPVMEGAEGFKLMYFHLVSCGISILLSFIVFVICV